MARHYVYLLWDEWGPHSVCRTRAVAEKYNGEFMDSTIEELEVDAAPRKVPALQKFAIKSIIGHDVTVPEVYPRILKAAITNSREERVTVSTRYTYVYVVGYTDCEADCACYNCGKGPAAFIALSLGKAELRKRALACRACREDEDHRLVLRVFKFNDKYILRDEIVPYSVLTRAELEAFECQDDSE